MVLLRQRLPGSFMCDMLRPDIRYTADTVFHFRFIRCRHSKSAVRQCPSIEYGRHPYGFFRHIAVKYKDTPVHCTITFADSSAADRRTRYRGMTSGWCRLPENHTVLFRLRPPSCRVYSRHSNLCAGLRPKNFGQELRQRIQHGFRFVRRMNDSVAERTEV